MSDKTSILTYVIMNMYTNHVKVPNISYYSIVLPSHAYNDHLNNSMHNTVPAIQRTIMKNHSGINMAIKLQDLTINGS